MKLLFINNDVEYKEEMMKKTRSFIIMAVIAVVFALLSVNTTFASGLTSGKAKVLGSVVDEDTGQPIAGVTIKLFCFQSQSYHESSPVSDAEGKWKAIYLRGGRWDVDFIKSGYETLKISIALNEAPGTKVPQVDVKLKKASGGGFGEELLKEIDVAKNLMVEKKYDQAIEGLNAAIAKFTDGGADILYLYVGNCYALKGDYTKAIEAYKKSLVKFPQNKELIISIGNAYSNLNDVDNAFEWYKKLKIEDIGNIDSLYNIGVIYYNKGEFDNALTFFKKTIEIDPSFGEGYYQVGMVYTALEKTDDAVLMLKKFMELAPDSPNFESAKAIVEAFKK